MFRSIHLPLALTLVIGLGACDVSNPLSPTGEGAGGEALAGPPAAVAQWANSHSGGGGPPNFEGLFDELAEKIESFGGLYRTGECSVTVVITDMSEEAWAIQMVHAALAPIHPCHGQVEVTAVQGQFTYLELKQWLTASRALLEIRGVISTQINYVLNRLVVTVTSHATAQAVLDALRSLGIPAEAVVIHS